MWYSQSVDVTLHGYITFFYFASLNPEMQTMAHESVHSQSSPCNVQLLSSKDQSSLLIHGKYTCKTCIYTPGLNGPLNLDPPMVTTSPNLDQNGDGLSCNQNNDVQPLNDSLHSVASASNQGMWECIMQGQPAK